MLKNRVSFQKGSKMNISGNLDSLFKFKPGDDWKAHFDNLEVFFDANFIKDDVIKVSFLISTIGEEAYQILRALCSPIPVYTKTFAELHELMKKHSSERFSVLKKRRHFSNMQQLDSESINQWYERVSRNALQCNFDGQLDDRLKDQFVAGMKEGKVLEKIWEEKN